MSEQELTVVAISRMKKEKTIEDKEGKKSTEMEEYDVAVLNDERDERKATMRFAPNEVKLGDSFIISPFMKQASL